MKEQAGSQLTNSLLYIIVVFVIVCSAFIGSPRFTIFTGALLALIVAATPLVPHYYSGVVFTNDASKLNRIITRFRARDSRLSLSSPPRAVRMNRGRSRNPAFRG